MSSLHNPPPASPANWGEGPREMDELAERGEALLPLHGFVEGDTLGLLIVVRDEESVREVARHLQDAAGVRVRSGASVALLHDGRELDPSWSVRQAGMRPLDRVDLVEKRRSEALP